MFYKLKAFIVALIIAAAGVIPAVAYSDNIKKYEEGIIEYNLKKSSADSVQEWINKELTRNAGLGSEWYVIALSNRGNYDFSDYNTALNIYLSKNEVGSASSRLKYALTYIAIGDKTNPYINEILSNSIGEQGIMSLVFGLHLLNNGCKSDNYSLSRLIDEVLSLQLVDGGWSVIGEYGDVDVTAMTVQALAVHYNNNPVVKSAVDNSLHFLSARQLENGGYSAYGIENPESTAQVIITLSSLNIDVCNDNRFIKNGNTVFDAMNSFRSDDGSFCHKENGASDPTATAQVLCSTIAYKNMKSGKSPFYIFDESENTSQKITTNETAAETTFIQSSITELTTIKNTTVFSVNASEKESIATISESDTHKTPTFENKTSPVRLTVILVVSVLIGVVCVLTKKNKFFVFVIVAAVAVIATVISASYKDKSNDTIGSVTISINCDVIKDENKSHIPQNGIILEETEVEIESGDTVYDVFSEVCQKNNVLFSANMKYIEGINNIYEMDFGKSSGWIYFVNGESPLVGCGNYELSDGDSIEWHYTRNMGRDLDFNIDNEYN